LKVATVSLARVPAAKLKFFLKKSLWPYTWAIVRICRQIELSRIR
jgi:hypothetical protein